MSPGSWSSRAGVPGLLPGESVGEGEALALAPPVLAALSVPSSSGGGWWVIEGVVCRVFETAEGHEKEVVEGKRGRCEKNTNWQKFNTNFISR